MKIEIMQTNFKIFISFLICLIIGCNKKPNNSDIINAYEIEPCLDFECDSTVVRAILASNGLENRPIYSYAGTDALGRISSLNLSRDSITTIPDEIGKLTNLRRLSLYKNQITVLPDAIGNLIKLTILDLHANQIIAIPNTFGKLTNLTSLNLAANQITTLPDTIGNLTKLTFLNLSFNKISDLPDAIRNLINLNFLGLGNNQITTIPDAIGNLTKIDRLALNSNQITTIPATIGNLTNLTYLWLDSNQITRLPEDIGNLKNLNLFSLSNNQLTTLPNSIIKLTHLNGLYLNGNRICSLSAPVESFVTTLIPKWQTRQDCATSVAVIPGNKSNNSLSLTLSLKTPNPYSPTSVRYTLPVRAKVSVSIYGVLGNLIRTLFVGSRGAWVYSVIWAGKDHQGRDVATGIYIVRAIVGHKVFEKTIVLLR